MKEQVVESLRSRVQRKQKILRIKEQFDKDRGLVEHCQIGNIEIILGFWGYCNELRKLLSKLPQNPKSQNRKRGFRVNDQC